MFCTYSKPTCRRKGWVRKDKFSLPSSPPYFPADSWTTTNDDLTVLLDHFLHDVRPWSGGRYRSIAPPWTRPTPGIAGSTPVPLISSSSKGPSPLFKDDLVQISINYAFCAAPWIILPPPPPPPPEVGKTWWSQLVDQSQKSLLVTHNWSIAENFIHLSVTGP
jgi:hypothetical protein